MRSATLALTIGAISVSFRLCAAHCWDTNVLFRVPHAHPVPEMSTGAVKAVMIDAPDWKGRATRAFAYVAVPDDARPDAKVPGVVLVHGGMSTADRDWVLLWKSRGYAAIAVDNCGGLPIRDGDGWKRHEFSGPPGWGRFATCDEPVKDQWFYHAVAVNVLADSYLGSLDGVDANRIGIVGGSWGGLLSCVISAVDARLKFAVSIYGCGYLGDHSFVSWRLGLQGATAEQGRKWLALWDPSLYLPQVRCPFLWVDGTNDVHFQLDNLAKSAALVKDSAFVTLVRLPHAGEPLRNPSEIQCFADHVVKGGRDIVRIFDCHAEGGRIAARFDASGHRLARARLVWTTSSNPDWPKRYYNDMAIDGFDAKSGMVGAALPKGTTVAFLALDTEEGLTFTTRTLFFGRGEGEH